MSVVVHLDLREEVRAELVSGYQLGLPFLDDLSADTPEWEVRIKRQHRQDVAPAGFQNW